MNQYSFFSSQQQQRPCTPVGVSKQQQQPHQQHPAFSNSQPRDHVIAPPAILQFPSIPSSQMMNNNNSDNNNNSSGTPSQAQQQQPPQRGSPGDSSGRTSSSSSSSTHHQRSPLPSGSMRSDDLQHSSSSLISSNTWSPSLTNQHSCNDLAAMSLGNVDHMLLYSSPMQQRQSSATGTPLTGSQQQQQQQHQHENASQPIVSTCARNMLFDMYHEGDYNDGACFQQQQQDEDADEDDDIGMTQQTQPEEKNKKEKERKTRVSAFTASAACNDDSTRGPILSRRYLFPVPCRTLVHNNNNLSSSSQESEEYCGAGNFQKLDEKGASNLSAD